MSASKPAPHRVQAMVLRMCADHRAPTPKDLATMQRLTGRAITQPQHPALDPVWRMAHKRPRLAEAMRQASHWRIRAMAAMLDDPAEYLCGHLTHAHRCPRCQAAKA